MANNEWDNDYFGWLRKVPPEVLEVIDLALQSAAVIDDYQLHSEVWNWIQAEKTRRDETSCPAGFR